MNLEGKQVKDLVTEMPGAAAIFERYRIDYCCGGHKTLKDACDTVGLDATKIVAELEAGGGANPAVEEHRDWQTTPLSELIAHIVGLHHAFVKQELPRLEALAKKVCAVHGGSHPELALIQKSFVGMKQELDQHLQKEEQVLFPHIARVEEAMRKGEPAPAVPFGTVQNPIRMMTSEHDDVGTELKAMRAASDDYSVPPEGCFSYRALYQGLEAFERDLHQHIHLENNILFPRAVVMESAFPTRKR